MHLATSSAPPISSLAQWIYQTLGYSHWCVKTRQRGNTLHILLEAQPSPRPDEVLEPLIRACLEQDFLAYLPQDRSPVYRLMVYGRDTSQAQAQWKVPLHLNQLDRHLALIRQTHPKPPQPSSKESSGTPREGKVAPGLSGESAVPTVSLDPVTDRQAQSSPETQDDRQSSSTPGGTNLQGTVARATGATQTLTPPLSKAEEPPLPITPASTLIVSNRSLARQGNPEAIAYYLSEILSGLGIAVQVQAKTLQQGKGLTTGLTLGRVQRLHILCESPYSLDPAILAEPLTERLRDLDLRGFRDAAVISRVQGETETDWVLRVDLTPPEEMLRDRARWGDVPALEALLDRHLVNQGIKTQVELQEKTLHLFCKSQAHPPLPPHQPSIMEAIRPLLQSLAPQSIHAAMVYGLRPGLEGILEQSAPLWVDWLSLPASQHPDLAPTVQELAEQGDLAAVTFLIDRLLNPNLQQQLTTGGIQVYLRRKRDLLHIMCDSPTCPHQASVAKPVIHLVRQLRLPRVAGVRIYGRRSGQKDPLWSQGVDFIPRQRTVPEATPDFAASAQHLGDLLTASTQTLGLGQEETEEDLLAPETGVLVALGQALGDVTGGLRRLLIRSQLCLALDQDVAAGLTDLGQVTESRSSGWFTIKALGIWASLGLLSTLLTDLSLGSVIQGLATTDTPNPDDRASQLEARLASLTPSDPQINTPLGRRSPGPDPSDNGFIALDPDPLPLVSALKPQPLSPNALGHHWQANPNYPSFDNDLLDQKMQLLQTRLLERGVPDVLIVGSSRALRGIDPQVLSQELQRLGYPDLNIFNFAINGSTAQVVDLQLRQILTPEQMPQLIIWADGARAFNSGRQDVTYNTLSKSPGYKSVAEGVVPPLLEPIVPETVALDPALSDPLPPKRPTWHMTAPQAWNPELVDQVGGMSMVYGERDRLKEWLLVSAASYLPSLDVPGVLQREDPADPLAVDPLDPEFSGIADAPEGEGYLDDGGFVALSTQFNPATYYEKYARVTGDYDRDYANFRITGDQEDALANLMTFVADQGIPLVFVNLPLTAEYLDPVRLDYEQEFSELLYDLQGQGQLLLRNLVDLWPWAVENFSDPSHLNRYGAAIVSTHLAQDPMIPWPSYRNEDSPTPTPETVNNPDVTPEKSPTPDDTGIGLEGRSQPSLDVP